MIEPVIIGDCTLYHGDNRDVLRQLPDNSIDSVCTDPPYALVSIVKRFANSPRNERTENVANPYGRTGRGFMGCRWDTGEVAFSEEFWSEVLRVLKPGGHVAAFGASRGYHRMACAIEDAGFEIRDSLAWMYATGFPKSHNVSNSEKFCQCRAEQASECDVRQVRRSDVSSSVNACDECGEVLQSRVPQQNTYGSWETAKAGRVAPYDGCSQSGLEGGSDIPSSSRELCSSEVRSMSSGIKGDGENGRLCDGASLGDGDTHREDADADGMCASSGSQTTKQRADEPRTLAGQPQSQNGGAWKNCGRCGKPMVPEGLGTALKPAFEPIVLARKPLSEGTVAANVLRWGTGALNIDGCRVPAEGENFERPAVYNGEHEGWQRPWKSDEVALAARQSRKDESAIKATSLGRWPANVVHDGSDEVVGAFPSTGGQQGRAKIGGAKGGSIYGKFAENVTANHEPRGDSGSAARFFYSAKASRADRNGSKHPTVKPIKLLQWLARLITPPGGTVLDPFAGSGTTGAACRLEGFKAVLCEREDEYVEDIKRRLTSVSLEDVQVADNDNEPPDLFRSVA